MYAFKGHLYNGEDVIAKLCCTLGELDKLFGQSNLDVEFAVTESGELYIILYVLQKICEGKILLIPSADLGYDWIFSHGIRGFITIYGGTNSHMAIRAGELGVSAVIGVERSSLECTKMRQCWKLIVWQRQSE